MQNIEKNKYWVWLSLIPNLGSVKKQKLLEKFKMPEIIYQQSKNSLMTVEGIGEKIAENILDKTIKQKLNMHLEFLKEKEIQLITIQDKEYPKFMIILLVYM